MEALSSSFLTPTFQETGRWLIQSAPTSSHNRKSLCFPKTGFGSRILASVSCQVSGDGQDDDQPLVDNGFSLPASSSSLLMNGCLKWLLKLCSDGLSHFVKDQTYSIKEFNNSSISSDTMTPSTTSGAGAGSGTRAGLFRTPISGGVQSATSVHDLPRPALAVRNLMEQARFAHLCTVMSRMHHRREGYPFGSLVDFAPDAMGHPIFSFSPLAIHTRNLLADPRCTLVVQIPGWSGLSNARVTIFGDVFPLPEDQQEWAHKQYIAKHQQGPSQQWGNFYYFRMQNISSDIYFIGGFGTVAWVNVKEYEALRPDKIAVDGGEQNLKELNAIFSKPLKELLSLETEVDDAALISIDSKGTDVRVRQGAQFNIQRLAFEEGHGVETVEEAKTALWNLIHRGRGLDKF
ncbi:hypothetical protein OSB04_004761 [Centaurea solstitialis]|uniref:CREG-like beta-barrel domain-containing protein n=1 Tax=Centaurea solstitialis TaxID=347529 RepID=A0AA38TQA1_9ASTR|nr:hypothetical protein OSB04_004761 [Centaurea solstitialis]